MTLIFRLINSFSRIWIIALIFFACFQIQKSAVSQNAPITTVATVTGAVTGTISVPVTVVDFSNIGAVSLALDYNYSILHYDQGVPHALFPTMASGDFDMGNGFHRISIGWYGSNTTLPPGSTLITLMFTYISGTSTLTWFDNGPSCEYVGEGGNVLPDTPTSTYYINGLVCGGIPVPGLIAGDNSVCQGQESVSYTVDPVAGVTSYHWTVPGGATIVSGNYSNSITVDYGLTASSGVVTVCGVNDCGNGPASTLPVTVSALPIANAGNDVSIPYGTSTILHAASGGVGSYSYHWSPENLLVNPDVQNPQTVNLSATTIFMLVVTNLASQCQNTDEVIVSITGGPLSVNPVSAPDTICRGETAQLYAGAGGGSGSYNYSWTCTPPDSPTWSSNLPNPIVSPDSTKVYHLTVYDGFSSVTGSTNLFVNQLPSAIISGGDSLCDDGSVALIEITLTGNPPWTCIYSDGINSQSVTGILTSPYSFYTSVAGTYSVTYVEDIHCSGLTYGSAVVSVFPIPGTPVITIDVNTLHSDICCGNQWYKDDALIPGATSQSYTAVADGNYFDIVTQNSCVSDTSNLLNVTVIGVQDHSQTSFSFFPNPSSDHIDINLRNCKDDRILVRIFLLNGALLGEYNLDEIGQGQYRLNIRNLSPGSYFVQIIASDYSAKRILMVHE